MECPVLHIPVQTSLRTPIGTYTPPKHTPRPQNAPGTGLLLLPDLETGGDSFDAPLAETPLDVLPVLGRCCWLELEREAPGRCLPSA